MGWTPVVEGDGKATAAEDGLDIERIAREENVDVRLLKAMRQIESSGGKNIKTSHKGARGDMQIIPDTFKRFAKPGEMIDNREHNLRVGARYLKFLSDRYKGDPYKIGAAYLSGEGNVDDYGVIDDGIDDGRTRPSQHGENLRKAYEALRGGGAEAQPAAAGNGWKGLDLWTRGAEPSAPGNMSGEVGVVEAAGKGLKRAMVDLAEAVNIGGQFIANRIDSKSADEFFKAGAEFWADVGKQYDPPPELQGNILDHPELLGKASWWAYNVANIVPSVAATIVPALGTYGLMARGPAAIARLARIGAAVSGGAVGGSLEGVQTYDELRKRGAPESEAAVAGTLMALASAGLNAISLDVFMGKSTSLLKKFLVSGSTEALTEWLEEPTEGAILSNTSVAKPEDDPISRAREGVNVIPPSFLVGGATGAAGGRRAEKDEKGDKKEGDTPANPPPKQGENKTAAPMPAPNIVPEDAESLLSLETPPAVTTAARETLPGGMAAPDGGMPAVIRSNRQEFERTENPTEQPDALAGVGRPQPTQWEQDGLRYEVRQITPALWERYIKPNSISGVETFDEYRQRYPDITHIRLASRDDGMSWQRARAPFIGTYDDLTVGIGATVDESGMPAVVRSNRSMPKVPDVIPEQMTQAADRAAEEVAAVPPPESGDSGPTEATAPQAPEPDSSVEDGAHQAATSPNNDLPEPTDGQKEAGNYQKGHIRVGGLEISIENPEGSVRTNKPSSPVKWETTMKHHYGYIRGTVGNDKDHIDAFVKPGTPEDFSGTVFVVDQQNPTSRKFDEHKAMIGFDSIEEAKAAYQENYAKDWKGLKAISAVPMEEFKQWLAEGDTTKEFAERSKQSAGEGDDSGANVPAKEDEGGGESALGAREAQQTGKEETPKLEGPPADTRTDKERQEARVKARKFAENELFTLLKFDERLIESAKEGKDRFILEAREIALSWMRVEANAARAMDGDLDRAYALESMGGMDENFFDSLFKEISKSLPKKSEQKPKRKLENTGEDLRRWWDKNMGDKNDVPKLVAEIEQKTVRAELLNPQWGENPTPGLLRWFELFRNSVQGFKSLAKAEYGSWREDTGTDVVARLAKDRPDSLVDLAEFYIDALQTLSQALDGATNIAGAAEQFTKWLDSSNGVDIASRLEVVSKVPLRGRFGINGYVTEYLTHGDRESQPNKKNQPITRPRLDNIARKDLPSSGRDERDVTPEETKKKFGFADIGFGKWVAAGRDQLHLNYAFDALTDLARFMGAPTTGIGLGGNLHFTIGALGYGKFAAHYQDQHPVQGGAPVRVFNVTNTRGDGSVAHEWGHALDAHLRRTPEGAAVMNALVNALKIRFEFKQIHDKAISALKGHVFMQGNKRVVKSDPVANARAVLDYYASNPGRMGGTSYKSEADRLGKSYWGNDAELFARAWEAFIYDELGGTSEYLVTGFVGDGMITREGGYRGTPYPRGDERKKFNQWMKALLDNIEWTQDGPVIKDMEKALAVFDMRAQWRAAVSSVQAALPDMYQQMQLEKEASERPPVGQDVATEEDLNHLFTPPPRDEEQAEEEENSGGTLSDAELSALFDEAAAEVKEQAQERPDTPPPYIKQANRPPAKNEAPASPPTTDRTAADLIAQAAKLGVTGINEALTGLSELFGGNKLKSFPAGFDPETYAKAKPHFEAALKAFQAAGKSLKDLFKLLIEKFGEGVKPYAIQFAKDNALGTNLDQQKKDSATMTVARKVLSWLENKGPNGISLPILPSTLFKWADEAFGGTMAQGKYEAKDAYDAIEAGVNLYVMNRPGMAEAIRSGDAQTAKNVVEELNQVLKMIPTQTRRSDEQIAFQQFSTPPQYAFVANWVAAVRAGELYLEPNGGTGSIAVWGEAAGAAVWINELSERRAAIAREVLQSQGDWVTTENTDHLYAIFSGKRRAPSVVVMNPPFSATAGRTDKRDTMIGANHVEQALQLLEPGGRLVAIVGRGMTMEAATFRQWWKDIRASYNVRANIGVGGKDYAKYGTSFETRLLVIDKDGPTMREPLTGSVESVSELPDLLGEIRADRPQSNGSRESAGEQPDQSGGAGETPPRLEQPGTSSGDGAGQAGDRSGTGSRGGKGGGGRTGGKSGSRGSGKGDGQSGGSDAGQQDTSGQDSNGGGGGGAGTDSARSDVTVGNQDVADEGALTDSVFEQYKPQRLQIAGAQPHPGDLVQSAAMASMMPPKVTYTPNLPKQVIEMKNGIGLSDAQLEAVVYAGQAFDELMPNGERRGFFIGDGTGVGKGREIAGIILDHLRKGKKKAVWVSERSGLIEDAKRDAANVGMDPKIINKIPSDSNTDIKGDGVIFTTYSTLSRGFVDESASGNGSNPSRTADKKRQRIEQLVKWLGEDFDGVIAFDEAHNMRGAIDTAGGRGAKKASLTGLAGVALQRKLPKARFVYVSATGATEVSNLSYATRLGLWGEGAPFTNVRDFVSKISAAGLSAMEIVAQSMKAAGMYISRSLSYLGINYSRVEHQLTPLQRQMYDEMAKAWRIVMRNIDQALDDTKQGSNGQAKAAARSQFWGAQLRFFNQVITALQMPSAIDAMRADLEAGHAVVIQLVNTNEAAQERAVSKIKAKKEEEGDQNTDIEDLDLTPRQILIDYLNRSFPVQQYEEYTDEDGNLLSRPVVDAAGKPVLNPKAVAARDEMIRNLEQIRMPDNPIDLIIGQFGHKTVAEITGRKRRFVRTVAKNGDVKLEEQTMGLAFRQADAIAFQNDEKRMLIFSDAGGTGFSFQADLTKKNQRLRKHYLVQPGWRADKAVQGFGRTHRTNQKQAPEYTLLLTDVPGHKRFVSSIARRLDQLGALTKGSREAKGSELFKATDNLESRYAQQAVEVLLTDMYYDSFPNGKQYLEDMGLGEMVERAENGERWPPARLPAVTQFINRVLILDLATQQVVFDAFMERLEAQIAFAQQQGTFDEGMQNLKALKTTAKREKVVYSDPKSGAETRYLELELTQPTKFNDFETALRLQQSATRPGAFMFNNASKRIYSVVQSGSRTNDAGTVIQTVRMIGPSSRRYQDGLQMDKTTKVDGKIVPTWEEVSEDRARELWEQEVEATPDTYTDTVHMVYGAIMPIWDRLPARVSVARAKLDDGRRVLGRVIRDDELEETLTRLGVGSAASEMSPSELFAELGKGNHLLLSNGWIIKPVTVAGEKRFQITSSYMSNSETAQLIRQGAFSETHQWQERIYIPTDDEAVFARVTQSKPVVKIVDPKQKDGGVDFAPFGGAQDNPGAGNAGWSEQRVDRLIRMYGVSFKENTTSAYAAMMSPKDFLALTASAEDQRTIEGETGPLDRTELANEVQEIFLDVVPSGRGGEFKVRSHEGRHRMVALSRAGIDSVPVVINLGSANRGELSRLSVARLDPQRNAQRGATIRGLEPISFANRTAILAMGGGSPSVAFESSPDGWGAIEGDPETGYNGPIPTKEVASDDGNKAAFSYIEQAVQQRWKDFPSGALQRVAPDVGRLSHSAPARARDLEAAQRIAESFGHELIWFDNAAGDIFNFGGFVVGADESRIYSNIRTGRPQTFVVGHELLHQMRRHRPDLYKEFVAAVKPLLKNRGDHTHPFAMGDDKLLEELLADFTGWNMMRRGFWRDMAAQDRSRFRRIADYVLAFLNDIVLRFNGSIPNMARFFTDVQRAQTALIDVMSQYQNPSGRAQDGGGGLSFAAFDNGNGAPPSEGRVALGFRERAQRVLDRMKMEADPFAFLPKKEDLLRIRYRLLGKIASFDEVAADIRHIFGNASEESQVAAYKYMITPDADKDMIPDPGVATMAERVKRLIESVGDAMVARGILSPEAREAHRGRYLPQVYLKFLLGDQNWRALGAGKKISNQGYLKQRKLDRRVGPDGEVHVYDAQTGKPLDDEFLNAVLGPVTDPGFLSSMAIVRPLRDMAILDYLDMISRNAAWVLPKSIIEWRGKRVSAHWAKTEAERLRRQSRHQDEPDRTNALKIADDLDRLADEALGEIEGGEHADYKQIPNTARYGRLRGIHVRREIYDDLMGVHDFLPDDAGWAMSLLGYGGVGTRMTQLWKAGKVSLNPPAQIRNFVSNMVLLQLSGVPMHRIPGLFVRALRQILNYSEWRQGAGQLTPEQRREVRHYLIALKYGVTESTFQAQELFQMQRDLLEIEKRAGKLTPLSQMKLFGGMLLDRASHYYQMTEALGKTMKIMDEIERNGTDEAAAALAAQEALFDYSLVSKNVRYLRNAPLGMPFLTFAVKVLPQLATVARHHPERFVPWVALAYGLPALVASAFDVDDDDLEKLKKAMPEWLQDRGHAYLMPWKDDSGRWQVLDLGYFFPWTTWTEPVRALSTGEPGKAVQALGMFSGPVSDLIVAMMTGRDSFTGREITQKGDPPKRQFLQMVNYMWSMAMPPIVTDHGALGHGIRAATGDTNRFGDPLSTPGQAALRAVGVNLYPMHPEQSRMQNMQRMMREINDTNVRLKQQLSNRALSESQRQSLVQEYMAEIRRRQEKLMEYKEQSEIHPNLRTQ